jgi:hypothetical protein
LFFPGKQAARVSTQARQWQEMFSFSSPVFTGSTDSHIETVSRQKYLP